MPPPTRPMSTRTRPANSCTPCTRPRSSVRPLARMPVQPVSFRYTVDDVTDTVDLESARSFELSLTAPQLASLRIEPITGTVGVATSWQEPVVAADLARDPDVTISASGLARRHDRPGRPALGDPHRDVRPAGGRRAATRSRSWSRVASRSSGRPPPGSARKKTRRVSGPSRGSPSRTTRPANACPSAPSRRSRSGR